MPAIDNSAIASMLDVMGDLLEVSGADKFRFLSYHKAANSIRSWPEPIDRVAAEGRLTEIPGVGGKLAGIVSEIVETGTFAEMERMKEQFAPALVHVMEVPGVGPKKARLLYEKLGVSSLDELEAALAAGKLDSLPGFGAKTAAGIAQGIERVRSHHVRTPLMDALPLARRMAEDLRRLPGVVRAEPAGSVRRMEETVGDIDILVAADDPPSVMEAVCRLPMVVRVLESGGTKTSVLTTASLQVDVRAVKPEVWGAALQYFTGSKEHNVALREAAKRRGLKVSEYGVFDSQRACIAAATEEDVYAALGMDVPPPESRLGHGEVTEALEHRLPRLVALTDVRGDLHAHTDSTDSRSSVEENRAKAAQLGYEYLVTTDHAYELKMVRGLSVEQLEEQWAHIDAINDSGDGGPVVLKGTELNIADDGSVDYPAEVLARFDICLASIHGGMRQSREQLTRRLFVAMENPYVDVISHLTGRIIGRRDPMDLDIDALVAKAAETGTALEINSYPDRLDVNDAIIRRARPLGVRFSIGTDAHAAAHMDFMPYGIAMARRGGLTPDDILNCQPLDLLRERLKRSRTVQSA